MNPRRLGVAIVMATLAIVAWPADAPAQSSDAERFNRIEAQMRALTGQIEELQFQVRQLTQQLASLQGGVAPAQLSQNQPVPLPQPPATAQQVGQSTLAPAAAPATNGSQPLDLSSLAGNGGAQLAPAAPTQQLGALTAVPTGPTGDPLRDYQQGYNLILNGNYGAAESFFRQFVEVYPSDVRAPDAQFWIGESYFARGQYREAADEFLVGYQRFPNSEKGPDTLLKLGLSLAGLGEREAACSTYAAVLKQYPEAPNSLRSRVESEQAVAAC